MAWCYQNFFIVNIVRWNFVWTFIRDIIDIRGYLVLNNSFLQKHYKENFFKEWTSILIWIMLALCRWNSHLSKLIIDPPAVADNGVVYSNCFRRRTSHQSIANIAKATVLMSAHSPTYLSRQMKIKPQWNKIDKIAISQINTLIVLYAMTHLYLNVSIS